MNKNRTYNILLILLFMFGVALVLIGAFGCAQAPKNEIHPQLVFHVTGTLYDPIVTPEMDWALSRNDKYLGIRSDAEQKSMRKQYMRHLEVTIKSRDRRTTTNGHVRDHFSTETRIDSD